MSPSTVQGWSPGRMPGDKVSQKPKQFAQTIEIWKVCTINLLVVCIRVGGLSDILGSKPLAHACATIGFILRISRSYSYIKVIGSRSRSQKQKGRPSVTKYKHNAHALHSATSIVTLGWYSLAVDVNSAKIFQPWGYIYPCPNVPLWVRVWELWSFGHRVIWSWGHLVTADQMSESFNHQWPKDSRPTGHQWPTDRVIWSSVTKWPSHLVTGHQLTRCFLVTANH